MKVVVVGGGYAGTIAANRLAKKLGDVDITVINPRPDFIERVRLHEQIAGSGTAATPMDAILRDEIHSRVGTVDKIGKGSVTLSDGAHIDYDRMILAVGSTVAPLAGTIPVGTWEGAQQAQAALAKLSAGDVVTVIGGGLTGVETASEVAAARPDLAVRLVGDRVAPTLTASGQERVRKGLRRLNVEIVEDAVTHINLDENAYDLVFLRSGGALASNLTLWAIMGTIPDLAARSGLQVNPQGRVIVDEYLRSVDDPDIFAVGDCAAVPGARLCCATASPQGAHAADTLARMATGRVPEPYSMGYTGQALSLGRRDGVVEASRRDGTPQRLRVSGRIGAVAKEQVSRYAKFGSRTATYGWLPGPK